MASTYAPPVSATQVGSYFVQQYYQVLQQQPDYTHQFYNDSSSIIRVRGGSTESASTESASTVLQIHDILKSLNFTATEIKTINSLDSWTGGVIVMVSGSVKSKDFSGWRKFMQTFFLAPQKKGYFVLNDIFHFVDDVDANEAPASGGSEEIHQTQEPAAAELELDSPPPSSTPLQEQPEVEAREYVSSVHIEGDESAEDYSFQDNQEDLNSVPESVEKDSSLEEPSPFVQTTEETVQETFPTTEEPGGEAPKPTYASILRAAKEKSSSTVSIQPSFTKRTIEPAVQQSNTAVPAVAGISDDIPTESLSHEEGLLDLNSTFSSGDSKSIYVKNLPPGVSTLEVLDKFKTFGRVKQDGVFVRSRPDNSACFAFVEFEDTQSAQNAVKASPMKIDGRPVYIEMRKPSINPTSRGGRRGRGRGGHFGARTSGRGSNQDGSDNIRMRSNGFGN